MPLHESHQTSDFEIAHHQNNYQKTARIIPKFTRKARCFCVANCEFAYGALNLCLHSTTTIIVALRFFSSTGEGPDTLPFILKATRLPLVKTDISNDKA